MADLKISQLTGATTPLAGTEVLPIVQSGSTVKVANNDLRPKQIQSNATSGVLQISGPAAAATRVMTVPDANFTAARTDAAQSFTGDQTVSNGNLSLSTTSPDSVTYQTLAPNTDKAWYFSKTCTTGATTNIFEVTGITNSSAINRRGVLEIWITMAGDNVNDQNGAALFIAPYYTGVFWNGIGASVTKLAGANTTVTMTLGVTASGSTLTFAITLGAYGPNHNVAIKTYVRSMYKDLTISAL